MAATTKGRATPLGLLTLYLLAGVVAALLGTIPLAAWLDTVGSNQAIVAGVADFGARTGLGHPYKGLHETVKNAGAAKFFGSR